MDSLFKISNCASKNVEKRTLHFFYGDSWVVGVNDCRGCLMQLRREEMDELMRPIYEDGDVWVIQDAEFAVPGFYVIGTKKHLASTADFSTFIALKVGLITSLTRKGMRDLLGIKFAEIYHEERMNNSHYHSWILPCWDYAVKRSGCMPTIFPSKVFKYSNFAADVVNYLRAFDFIDEKEKILKFNTVMREYFDNIKMKCFFKRIKEVIKTDYKKD